MSLGTYAYGLAMGWAGGRYYSRNTNSTETQIPYVPVNSILGPLNIPGHEVSVLCIGDMGVGGTDCLCYCICVSSQSNVGHAVKKKAVVRRELAKRLYWRYSLWSGQGSLRIVSTLSKHFYSECTRDFQFRSTNEVLPGYSDASFLKELCKSVERKYEGRLHPHARTVSLDLYSVWVTTSHITVELFADALNESGVLKRYCSTDKDDIFFGSAGCWEEVEDFVEGGGGNPPFETGFLHRMMDEFDKGARGFKPYCRCVLLPLAKSHGVLERAKRLSAKGMMLVHIPAGCLTFKHQVGYCNVHVS